MLYLVKMSLAVGEAKTRNLTLADGDESNEKTQNLLGELLSSSGAIKKWTLYKVCTDCNLQALQESQQQLEVSAHVPLMIAAMVKATGKPVKSLSELLIPEDFLTMPLLHPSREKVLQGLTNSVDLKKAMMKGMASYDQAQLDNLERTGMTVFLITETQVNPTESSLLLLQSKLQMKLFFIGNEGCPWEREEAYVTGIANMAMTVPVLVDGTVGDRWREDAQSAHSKSLKCDNVPGLYLFYRASMMVAKYIMQSIEADLQYPNYTPLFSLLHFLYAPGASGSIVIKFDPGRAKELADSASGLAGKEQ
jgi:hypothetical protein